MIITGASYAVIRMFQGNCSCYGVIEFKWSTVVIGESEGRDVDCAIRSHYCGEDHFVRSALSKPLTGKPSNSIIRKALVVGQGPVRAVF